MLTSADQLWDHLWAQRAHTLALRDDYAFWARHRFTAAAGKPLRVHLRDPARQDLFFDDNVHDDDAHIIDARDPRGRALPWAASATSTSCAWTPTAPSWKRTTSPASSPCGVPGRAR
jgi:hypothetical protein